jgi:hypothetical protein
VSTTSQDGLACVLQQRVEVVGRELEVTRQPPVAAPRVAPHAHPALALADQAAQQRAVAAHDFAGRDDVAVRVGVHHPAHPVHADDDRAVRGEGGEDVVDAERPPVFRHVALLLHGLGAGENTGAFVLLAGPFVELLRAVVDGERGGVGNAGDAHGFGCELVRPAMPDA